MFTQRPRACICSLSLPPTCSFLRKTFAICTDPSPQPLYSFYLFTRPSRCHQSLIPKWLSLLGNNTKRTPGVFKTRLMVLRKHVKICLRRLTNITNKKGMTPNRRTTVASTLALAPRTLGTRLTLNSRSDMPASVLTSETMTRFEEQPDNNLQPLDDRVMEYRKASPILGEQKSTKQHHNPMADSMKDWSDKWEKLERS
jgi:hypothetical protein